eukprot:scaffold29718_cov23-Tisochrysis_lutea.AAC.1
MQAYKQAPTISPAVYPAGTLSANFINQAMEGAVRPSAALQYNCGMVPRCGTLPVASRRAGLASYQILSQRRHP